MLSKYKFTIRQGPGCTYRMSSSVLDIRAECKECVGMKPIAADLHCKTCWLDSAVSGSVALSLMKKRKSITNYERVASNNYCII